MDPASIREFVARRWDLVQEEKTKALADRYRRGGPKACLAAFSALRERFLRQHPQGYTEASRELDLASHLELVSKLSKVRDGLARR